MCMIVVLPSKVFLVLTLEIKELEIGYSVGCPYGSLVPLFWAVLACVCLPMCSIKSLGAAFLHILPTEKQTSWATPLQSKDHPQRQACLSKFLPCPSSNNLEKCQLGVQKLDTDPYLLGPIWTIDHDCFDMPYQHIESPYAKS